MFALGINVESSLRIAVVEVTRCISDRAQRCYWELEYKWCVSTGTARYGGLHFHDQFYQTAPLGATPQMGWIASRVGGWRNPPNCYDPSPVLKKALFCVLQCKKKENKKNQTNPTTKSSSSSCFKPLCNDHKCKGKLQFRVFAGQECTFNPGSWV